MSRERLLNVSRLLSAAEEEARGLAYTGGVISNIADAQDALARLLRGEATRTRGRGR